jgi:hypothetical protein
MYEDLDLVLTAKKKKKEKSQKENKINLMKLTSQKFTFKNCICVFDLMYLKINVNFLDKNLI